MDPYPAFPDVSRSGTWRGTRSPGSHPTWLTNRERRGRVGESAGGAWTAWKNPEHQVVDLGCLGQLPPAGASLAAPHIVTYPT